MKSKVSAVIFALGLTLNSSSSYLSFSFQYKIWNNFWCIIWDNYSKGVKNERNLTKGKKLILEISHYAYLFLFLNNSGSDKDVYALSALVLSVLLLLVLD